VNNDRRTQLARLLARLQQATGSDRDLDRAIQSVLEPTDRASQATSAPAYTGSIPLCFSLVRRYLPDWILHLGYGVRGIFPYAALSERTGKRFEATAPTVPLAVLRALVKTLEARIPVTSRPARPDGPPSPAQGA
jgi:hypothetical protein